MKLLAWPAFVSISAGMRVFAQTGSEVSPSIISLVGNLGIAGALVWHLYHTTQAIPKMQDRFSDQLDKIREQFEGAIDRLQTTHDAEIQRLQGMLFDNLKEYRRAVHDTRDVAHTAVMQAKEASVLASQSGTLKKREEPENKS